MEERPGDARSFRRGATTRAQLADVPSSVIEWINRWGTGTEVLVKGPMRIIYSERRLMMEHFLKFSRALYAVLQFGFGFGLRVAVLRLSCGANSGVECVRCCLGIGLRSCCTREI